MKIALFDFCETLANFQTADPYVDFVRAKVGTSRMKRWEIVKFLFNQSRLLQFLLIKFSRNPSVGKSIKLYQLKGLREELLEELGFQYYREVIKPNLISETCEELLRLKREGFKIYIVSGGYNLYLKWFVEDFGIDDFLSTKIAFKDGVCCGRFEGKDCMREQKVKVLDIYFRQKPYYSVSYSDSESDLPFLRWSTTCYVVSKKHSQDWAKRMGMKEIIWK